MNLCLPIIASTSVSNDTSVRHNGHDVWFHSHLSTQQALQTVDHQTVSMRFTAAIEIDMVASYWKKCWHGRVTM